MEVVVRAWVAVEMDSRVQVLGSGRAQLHVSLKQPPLRESRLSATFNAAFVVSIWLALHSQQVVRCMVVTVMQRPLSTFGLPVHLVEPLQTGGQSTPSQPLLPRRLAQRGMSSETTTDLRILKPYGP